MGTRDTWDPRVWPHPPLEANFGQGGLTHGGGTVETNVTSSAAVVEG